MLASRVLLPSALQFEKWTQELQFEDAEMSRETNRTPAQPVSPARIEELHPANRTCARRRYAALSPCPTKQNLSQPAIVECLFRKKEKIEIKRPQLIPQNQYV
eukprot:TRINITY_DN2465_c0_g1_i3.p1 TRINITY_DN2465_c0_g1~~TRINITY_DN2465_c0_g1_i3.p1  ORF type:complete len:103 (-),score=10.36 TRINITY_DN2465_c0_g1_i3:3-311(-)